MGKESRKESKEVDFMALAQRCNPGCIISYGKEKEFFKKVNDSRPTEEFWEECMRLRNNISQESLDIINELMDREE